MKYFLVSTVVLVFVGFSFAQPIIKVQPNVQSYLQEKSAKHRSGLLSAKDYSSNYEAVREGERVQIMSFENPSNGKESFLERNDIVSKGVGKNFQYVKYYEDENIVHLDSCKSGFKADVGNLKKNQNQESKKLLKSLFPDSIAKQFDLFVVGTEYISSQTKLQTEIAQPAEKIEENGYTLLFQRVYKGRVIRSFDNHLSITIDKNGYVKSVEIAWQDLFPIGELANIGNSSAEIVQALELTAKLDYSAISREGDTLAVKSFDAKGAAKAWCKVNIDGKNVLFPCLSYSGDIETSDGEIIPTVIDAPYSVDYRAKPLMLGGRP